VPPPLLARGSIRRHWLTRKQGGPRFARPAFGKERLVVGCWGGV